MPRTLYDYKTKGVVQNGKISLFVRIFNNLKVIWGQPLRITSTPFPRYPDPPTGDETLEWMIIPLSKIIIACYKLKNCGQFNYIYFVFTFQIFKVFSVIALAIIFSGFTSPDFINPVAIAWDIWPPPTKPSFTLAAIFRKRSNTSLQQKWNDWCVRQPVEMTSFMFLCAAYFFVCVCVLRGVYCNGSQMTSQRVKNKKVRHEKEVEWFFTRFDVFCDLLQYTHRKM